MTEPDATQAPPAPVVGDATPLSTHVLNRGKAFAFYQLLVESVKDYAIFAIDPDGKVVTWNAGAERIKGYRANEIIGRPLSTFYTQDDVAAGKPYRLLDIARREGRVSDEGWRIRKDGTRFWASVVLTALRDENNTLIGFAKITRDLTEQKMAVEHLQQSEERFRLLTHSVVDYAIFMLDPNGFVASWNEGAVRLKGYAPDEIIGRHFSTFYPLADIEAGKPARELEIAIREGRVEDEGWRIRKDGSRFWANVVITALRTPSGELVGFAKVTRDLTERIAAQQRAVEDARVLAAAEASNRIKTEFLNSMSHELRTPLNAIGGYVELLRMGLRGPVTEEQRHDLERIGKSQRHLLSLINDILNYSRIEGGHLEFKLEPVPIGDVIESVSGMIEPQALLAGIDFTTTPPIDASVLADRTKVEQILLNLLSNAIKFTPKGGRVTVTGTSGEGTARISVADTGPGIPAGEVEAIFEPFVQLGRTLSTGPEGTGLGLAISRELARSMNGDLTVTTTPGKGAVFTLELPKL